MSSIGHHLVRRAFDATQDHLTSSSGFRGINPADEPQGQDDARIKQLAIWGIAIIYLTGILYMAIMSAISYTYGDVIATLAMIETPTAAAFKISSDDDNTTTTTVVDAPLLSDSQKSEKSQLLDSDLYLIKQPPITSKMFLALKHLKSQCGRLAGFRGLHVSLIYHILHSLIVNLFTANTRNHLLRSAVAIITTIALCRLQMTWTHIVISAPSTKRWWRRIPSVKAGKNIIIPTAVYAIAVQAAIYVPAALFATVYPTLFRETQLGDNAFSVQKVALVEILAIGLIAIGTVFLIVIPADVTLKRVQASMLPEEDETVVPFDRTFAGKVVPEVVGGSGAVGMLDAWKTFDRSARIRLIKLYGKIFAIQAFITFMFFFTVIAELRLIMGDELKKMVVDAHADFVNRR